MPSINIENAQIKTASIEIKALTINGRQLTLSTFRQLPEEDLINYETMTLNGLPWGTINYFWKDNGSEHTHWHIIWQKEKELKRYCICKSIKDMEFMKKINSRLENQESHRNKYVTKIETYLYEEYKWLDRNIPRLEKTIKTLESQINELNKRDKNSDVELYYIKETFRKLFGEKIFDTISENERFQKVSDTLMQLENKLAHKKLCLSNAKNAYEVIEKEKLTALKIKLDDSSKKLLALIYPFNDLPQLFIAI